MLEPIDGNHTGTNYTTSLLGTGPYYGGPIDKSFGLSPLKKDSYAS
jgi:hypothetical protein